MECRPIRSMITSPGDLVSSRPIALPSISALRGLSLFYLGGSFEPIGNAPSRICQCQSLIPITVRELTDGTCGVHDILIGCELQETRPASGRSLACHYWTGREEQSEERTQDWRCRHLGPCPGRRAVPLCYSGLVAPLAPKMWSRRSWLNGAVTSGKFSASCSPSRGPS